MFIACIGHILVYYGVLPLLTHHSVIEDIVCKGQPVSLPIVLLQQGFTVFLFCEMDQLSLSLALCSWLYRRKVRNGSPKQLCLFREVVKCVLHMDQEQLQTKLRTLFIFREDCHDSRRIFSYPLSFYVLRMWRGLGFFRMNKAVRIRIFLTVSIFEKWAGWTAPTGIVN
jgi:hypothetical protein